MRVLLLLSLACVVARNADAFSLQPKQFSKWSSSRGKLLFAEGSSDNEKPTVSQLGFSEKEVQRSQQSEKEEMRVNVNLVGDVDPLTLTAIGFTLIAFNFFVFANMGDGGIAGIVAQIINLSNQ